MKPEIQHVVHNLDENDKCRRNRWYQLWLPSTQPSPPPTSLADAPMTPLASTSFVSVLTYAWLTPLITLGWQRTLQAPDLWRGRAEDEAGPLGQSLDEAWARRLESSKASSEERIKWRWFGFNSRNDSEPSLALALNDVLGRRFWMGGVIKVIGDICQLMTPLLIKAIIQFAQERSRGGPSAPQIGQGIGLAIGLTLLTVCSSVCTHQFFWRSMTTGVAARAALVASLCSRGLNFGPEEPRHDIINHVSADISRVAFCAQWLHAIWTTPIQISVCFTLLCIQLGPAALAGFALFAFLIPIQKALMSYQICIRKKSMVHMRARVSLLRELLGNMKIVKVCAYETYFEDRLNKARAQELEGNRGLIYIKAAHQAVAFAIPTLAAVLSFITYVVTHDERLNPAVVFPSMVWFQMLRQPLLFLPRALSSAVDAKNALGRLKPTFLTEATGTQFQINPDQESALVVEDAEWVWYHQPSAKSKSAEGEQQGKANNGDAQRGRSKGQGPTRTVSFRVTDVTLNISRGSIVGIVGPIGSGKSSLLLGLLGEMPRTRGNVSFGEKTAYCSQAPWIQNASLRNNIVFGRPWDEARYWASIRDASLEVDLELLPDGDLTEIGAKGNNLSGGQKQRVSIARALYDDSAGIFLLDDPLS